MKIARSQRGAPCLPKIKCFGTELPNQQVEYQYGKLLEGISGGAAGIIAADTLSLFDFIVDCPQGLLWTEFHPDAVPAKWDKPDFDSSDADLLGFTPLMRAPGLAALNMSNGSSSPARV